MRATPSTSLHRYAMRAGAVAAAGALLAGCSDDGSLPDLSDAEEAAEEAVEGAQEDAQEAGEEAVDEALEDAQETAEDAVDSQQGDGEDDDSWWDTVVSWFDSDEDDDEDEESDPDEEDADGAAAEEEEDEESNADEEDADDGDDDGWWDTVVSWFDSDEDDDEDEESDPDEEDADEEDTAAYGLPGSCAEAGAAEAVGDLVPFGVTVQEESGQVDEIPDAGYLICAWEGTEESFTLVYTENVDPGNLIDLAGETGEQEMNWEVDVDVDVENYRSTEADELGGDLDYSTTVEGSTQIMHLSLPDNFSIAAVSIGQDTSQQDLERVVYDAADRL